MRKCELVEIKNIVAMEHVRFRLRECDFRVKNNTLPTRQVYLKSRLEIEDEAVPAPIW